MSILQIINQIAADPSRNAKEAILTANKDNETLKAVFKAAYDPTVKYYLKKIPEAKSALGDAPRHMTIELPRALSNLSVLSERNLTGTAAIEYLADLLFMMNEDDREVISRVIVGDLKCGATDSTANKIWKNLIPEYPYMRCCLPKDTKLDKWNWKKGAYSQLKADAMFANLDIFNDGEVMLTSRNGSQFPITAFSGLAVDALETFPKGVRINGELQVMKDGKLLAREIGNGILNSVQQGEPFGPGEVPVYDVWDIIPIEFAVPSGKYEVAYSERWATLSGYLSARATVTDINSIRPIPTRIVYSLAEAYDHYFELTELGFEGTILKEAGAIWFDGTSKWQMKLKIDCDVDLVIMPWRRAGKGKNAATFGSIPCQTSDGLLEVYVSGFKDAKRKELHEMGEKLNGMIMTVRFNNIMRPKDNGMTSLFLPRYVELRTDKTEADSLQRVKDQFEAIVNKAKLGLI